MPLFARRLAIFALIAASSLIAAGCGQSGLGRMSDGPTARTERGKKPPAGRSRTAEKPGKRKDVAVAPLEAPSRAGETMPPKPRPQTAAAIAPPAQPAAKKARSATSTAEPREPAEPVSPRPSAPAATTTATVRSEQPSAATSDKDTSPAPTAIAAAPPATPPAAAPLPARRPVEPRAATAKAGKEAKSKEPAATAPAAKDIEQARGSDSVPPSPPAATGSLPSPPPAPPPLPSATPPPRPTTAPPPVAGDPITPPAPVAAQPSGRQIAAVERSRALADGLRALLAGDTLKARSLFTAAFDGERPNALVELARTYDPNYLNRLASTNARADVAIARQHYQRAVQLGSSEARSDLQRLEALIGR